MYVVWDRTTKEYKTFENVWEAQRYQQQLPNGAVTKLDKIKSDPRHAMHSVFSESEPAAQVGLGDLEEAPSHNNYDAEVQAGLRQDIVNQQGQLRANQDLPPINRPGVVQQSPGRLNSDYVPGIHHGLPLEVIQPLPPPEAQEVPEPEIPHVPMRVGDDNYGWDRQPSIPTYREEEKVRMTPPSTPAPAAASEPVATAKQNLREALGNVVTDGQGEAVRTSSGPLRTRADEQIVRDEQDPFWWMR
jgi:hypothetical protein